MSSLLGLCSALGPPSRGSDAASTSYTTPPGRAACRPFLGGRLRPALRSPAPPAPAHRRAVQPPLRHGAAPGAPGTPARQSRQPRRAGYVVAASKPGAPRAAAAADFAGELPSAGVRFDARALTRWLPALHSNYDSEIFGLALPALLSVLLDPLMGLVDVAIVGRLGTEPLAAVGLCTIVYNFSNFIWNFLLYTTTPRIAAAVSKKDGAGVSAITAQGLWVASAIGVSMSLVLWNCGPAIFAAMGATPAVAASAVPYLRGRCIASPAVMAFYVLSGTFRGYKVTRTPLLAGLISNVVHLFLDVALVFWAGWGVAGAALATSLSHWVTIAILMGQVTRKGYLRLPDLARPPTWAEVAPMLRNGALLSTRSLLAMSTLMWATKLVAGLGAASLAAHEIVRQIWVFSNQAFTSLDIATQSLVAFYLGAGDRRSAAAVFARVLSLAVWTGVAICGALLAARCTLPAAFSQDPAVVAQVAAVLPVVAAFMPLDAAASAMDGVLLGAQEAAWMSRTMVVTSAACAVGLLAAQSWHWGLLMVWVVIKLLTVGRLTGNAWRIRSAESPLRDAPAAAEKGNAGLPQAA